MFRQLHDRWTHIIERASQERNKAVLAGQQARREVERATQELRRVYHDAGVFVQQNNKMVDLT